MTKGHSLIWRNWDEESFLVYHTGSGDTHLLNRVTAEVLRQLERADADVGELAHRVAQSFEVEADDEFVQQIEQLLAHLDELGLVDPT